MPKAEIAAVMARPAANAAALAGALMAEGLCVAEGDRVRLP